MSEFMSKERILFSGCPLCRSTKIGLMLSADCSNHPMYKPPLSSVINWFGCDDCGHVFTEGYFSEEALAIVFSDTQENQLVGYDMENQRVVSSRIVEKLLPFISSGRWLDIGFGNASLLFTAEEYGFTPIGVDLRRGNVEILNSLGIEAHCTDLLAFHPEHRFSVISMADVLEHTAFPTEILAKTYALLDDNGLLFLSMPNSDSWMWKALNDDGSNPYWGEIEHYHNFGRDRLYALLREFGFEPLRYGISERYRACMEVVARKIKS